MISSSVYLPLVLCHLLMFVCLGFVYMSFSLPKVTVSGQNFKVRTRQLKWQITLTEKCQDVPSETFMITVSCL